MVIVYIAFFFTLSAILHVCMLIAQKVLKSEKCLIMQCEQHLEKLVRSSLNGFFVS